jgi:hypothetical protein
VVVVGPPLLAPPLGPAPPNDGDTDCDAPHPNPILRVVTTIFPLPLPRHVLCYSEAKHEQ